MLGTGSGAIFLLLLLFYSYYFIFSWGWGTPEGLHPPHHMDAPLRHGSCVLAPDALFVPHPSVLFPSRASWVTLDQLVRKERRGRR